jgi:predicted acetyltransferase
VLSPHGTYTYRYLDGYFTEPDRQPYFITVDGEFAGFALARGDADDDGFSSSKEVFAGP